MKAVSIYTTEGQMAYQFGNSRTLVSKTGCHQFQKNENGVWRSGRNSYAHSTVEKVKAALRSGGAA